jgi:hypothetical protein
VKTFLPFAILSSIATRYWAENILLMVDSARVPFKLELRSKALDGGRTAFYRATVWSSVCSDGVFTDMHV